jgi:hypothetical protein
MNFVLKEIYRHLLGKEVNAQIVGFKRESGSIITVVESNRYTRPLYYCFRLKHKEAVQEHVFERRWQADRWLQNKSTGHWYSGMLAEIIYWYGKFYYWINK